MKFVRIFLVVMLAVTSFASLQVFAQDDGTTRFSINPVEFDTTNTEVGFARFVHTAADVGAVDIYQDGVDTAIVENLHYGDVTDFITLPVSDQPFIVHAAGTDEELYRLHVGVANNMSWLISPSGLQSRGAFIMEPFNVIRTDIPEDQAAVRVINYVWGGPNLSVRVSGSDDEIQPMAYLQFSDRMFDPGSYDLEVVTDTGEVLAQTNVTMEAQKVYNMLIMGSAEGVGDEDAPAQPVELVVIETEPYVARVKFVNERDEPVDIHLRPGDERVVTNLAAGAESDFITLDSQSATFIAYAPDSGTVGQELTAGYLYLSPNREITVVIDEDNEMNILEEVVILDMADFLGVDTSVDDNATDMDADATKDASDADATDATKDASSADATPDATDDSSNSG